MQYALLEIKSIRDAAAFQFGGDAHIGDDKVEQLSFGVPMVAEQAAMARVSMGGRAARIIAWLGGAIDGRHDSDARVSCFNGARARYGLKHEKAGEHDDKRHAQRRQNSAFEGPHHSRFRKKARAWRSTRFAQDNAQFPQTRGDY